MKKLAGFVIAAVLFGAAFAQDPIVIGVNLELSGRQTSLGTPELEGAEVALEQIGEVLGRPIELSVCDNASEVEQSVACANRFVDEGVVAVIGSGSSSKSIPAAEVLEEAGIIMVSPSSTNNETTQIGDYIFRVAYNDEFQGKVLAGYATNELKVTKVAIFRQQDDPYSLGLAQSFQAQFESLGGEVISIDFVAGTADFTAQIGDLSGFEPEAIFMPIFCAEAGSLAQQLRQQGYEQPFFGSDALDDPQCIDAGGDAFNGMVITAFAVPEQLEGEVKQRADDFAALFKVSKPEGTFNGFTLAGADAFNVIVEAIKVAGTDDRVAVKDALMGLENYPGVTGSITFKDTDGTPADRVMGFFQYENATYPGTPLTGVNFNFDENQQ
ncbi:MAG: ABC transporter substrate-binding protein [Trueperaceae bacterium]